MGRTLLPGADPNRIVIQLVTWVGTPPQGLGHGCGYQAPGGGR